jgi:hypothetical protein
MALNEVAESAMAAELQVEMPRVTPECHEHDIYANRSAKIAAIDRAYSQPNRMCGSRAIPVARIL